MSDRGQGQGLRELKRPCVLLVEGDDDEAMLCHLASHHGLDRQMQIVSAKGRDNFAALLRTGLEKVTGWHSVRAVGVVADAEEDWKATFERLRDAIERSAWGARCVPQQPGTVVEGPPACGVFLFPRARCNGALETLVWQILAERPEWRCTKKWLQCVETTVGAAANDAERDKRAVRVLLHAQPRHKGRFLLLKDAARLNIERGLWSWDDDTFEPLLAFLKQLAAASGRRFG